MSLIIVPFSLVFTFFEGQNITLHQIYGGFIILGGALIQSYFTFKKSQAKKLFLASPPSIK